MNQQTPEDLFGSPPPSVPGARFLHSAAFTALPRFRDPDAEGVADELVARLRALVDASPEVVRIDAWRLRGPREASVSGPDVALRTWFTRHAGLANLRATPRHIDLIAWYSAHFDDTLRIESYRPCGR